MQKLDDLSGATPWTASGTMVKTIDAAIEQLDQPLYVFEGLDGPHYTVGGTSPFSEALKTGTMRITAIAPPCLPNQLGDPEFCRDHGLAYPYYAGSMAHGIASKALVYALGKSGALSFFGSAGMALPVLADHVRDLASTMKDLPFGVNLINSPGDSAQEKGAVALFLEHGIRLIEASAYILPTPALVKYRLTGVHVDNSGRLIVPNSIIAKVSRIEVARRFMEPPSPKLVAKLLAAGEITEQEAQLAPQLPLAQDITAEADSGGHTDHRSALAVLPSMLYLRDKIQLEHGYRNPLRVGLAGGIGTPQAAAAAFAMGAAYIVTGSINQACLESGTSDTVRALLAQAGQTDVADAPAADMFEMGVTVQVLKRGVRFAEKASRLYALYRTHACIEDIPDNEQKKLEETVFLAPLEHIWAQTQEFFQQRNPALLEKAARNPKHKMALTFRWYLGQASHWANQGVDGRKEDYQIWCGPAMGAFNDWVRGTFLESPETRSAPLVAHNLLYGAALLTRVQCLRAQRIAVGTGLAYLRPRHVFPEFMPTMPEEYS